MTTTSWLTAILLVMVSGISMAQNPVPDPDTIPDPVRQGDPAVQTLPQGLDYVDDLKRIAPTDVPEKVKQALESSAQYSNWQRATLYRDENKDEYVVQFHEKGTSTTYRFTKDGSPIVDREEK